MNDLKQAQVLLATAERDMSAIKGMGDGTIFADEIFGFHVQQAVEKLLKAWLALLGKAYPATHDLARLLEILKTYDTNVLEFCDLTEYTSYAVRFRYSVSDHDATSLNRSVAVDRVSLLLDVVRSMVADPNE
jgi:hypothetical protein